MTATSALDVRLQELAERYYDLLEDQLYDPQPEVDGYGKEKQRQYVVILLRDLAHDAASLTPERDEESFAFVRLNEDGEALCPQCDTPLTATIHIGSEDVTPFWHPDDQRWEYMADGGDTDIECFSCPGCGWSASYVEPHEDEQAQPTGLSHD
jgi:hypothetical protein